LSLVAARKPNIARPIESSAKKATFAEPVPSAGVAAAQWKFWQVWLPEHVPQLSVPPQPLPGLPQLSPSEAHVDGVQVTQWFEMLQF
jgi:hypothetical protein